MGCEEDVMKIGKGLDKMVTAGSGVSATRNRLFLSAFTKKRHNNSTDSVLRIVAEKCYERITDEFCNQRKRIGFETVSSQ